MIYEVVEHLRREADEIRALGEEHTSEDERDRGVYRAVELALTTMADALEAAA